MNPLMAASLTELIGRDPLLARARELAAVRELGIAALEVWAPWHLGPDDVPRVRQLFDDLGMRVACVSTPSYLCGDTEERGKALIETSIEIADGLGAGTVNTYFGHGGENDESSIVGYSGMVTPLLDRASEAGVVIVIENEFDAFGHDPDHTDISRRPRSLRRLMEHIGHPAMRLNLDPANFLCAGADAREAAELLAPWVEYVHVKDAVKLHDRGDVHRPRGWHIFPDGQDRYKTTRLGDGDVPWVGVLHALDAVGYSGWYTLEPHCASGMVLDELRFAAARLEALLAARRRPSEGSSADAEV